MLVGSCGGQIMLRTSSDVFIFNLGLCLKGLFWERYILKGPNRIWRALKTSILNIACHPHPHLIASSISTKRFVGPIPCHGIEVLWWRLLCAVIGSRQCMSELNESGSVKFSEISVVICHIGNLINIDCSKHSNYGFRMEPLVAKPHSLIHTMPTLGQATGPHHWESFHLDKSSCLVCTSETTVRCIQWGYCEYEEESLLVAVNFRKRCIFHIKRDSSYCLGAIGSLRVGMV